MILYNFSLAPNGQRVTAFLKEKNISIDSQEINVREGEQFKEPFQSMNPFNCIPFLKLDDGTIISESVSICITVFASLIVLCLLLISVAKIIVLMILGSWLTPIQTMLLKQSQQNSFGKRYWRTVWLLVSHIYSLQIQSIKPYQKHSKLED